MIFHTTSSERAAVYQSHRPFLSIIHSRRNDQCLTVVVVKKTIDFNLLLALFCTTCWSFNSHLQDTHDDPRRFYLYQKCIVRQEISGHEECGWCLQKSQHFLKKKNDRSDIHRYILPHSWKSHVSAYNYYHLYNSHLFLIPALCLLGHLYAREEA